VNDPLLDALNNFQRTGMKQARIAGLSQLIRDMLLALVKEHSLPIEVLERRNVIYFKRTDLDA